MTDLSNDSRTLALSPPYVVDATLDVKSEDPNAGVPLVGVALRLTGSGHLKVVVDPPSPVADSVALHFNGSATPIDAPVTVDPATKRITFEVSRALLRNGLQFFHYVTKRIGGNDVQSPNLWVLYSRDRPGGLDPIVDDQDIHEGLGIDLPEDVKQNGVDLVVAGRGVPLTVSYAFAKLHDVVSVDCNGFLFKYTVTKDDLGGAFDILLPKAAFVGGGNSPTFAISYTANDQLGNDTQNSLPSPSLSIKVDLTPKVELPPAPFVPALVGNVISPGKHTTGFVVRVDWTKGFKAGDKAKLVVKGGAAGAGTPVFTFVALNANFRANFQLTPAFILANAGREVVFTWLLSSGGKETESEPLTLVIESVNVTDPNFPTPEIVEAYGTNAVDLRAFTGDAHIVCAPWPFIAAGQKIWLHVLGTGKDGNPKTVVIEGTGKTLTPAQIQSGLDYVLPRKELELFEPGKELRVRLRVDFYPNENADTIRTFTLKRYTLVTAGMKATLEFRNAPYRIAPLGRLTNIEMKLVNENGEFIKEASVFLTIPNTFKYADGTTGRREFKTSLFGELVIPGVMGPDAPGTAYTVKAEYDGKVVIAKLNVTDRGRVGELDIGSASNAIAISSDGTKICAIKPHSVEGRLTVVDVVNMEVMGAPIDKINGYNVAIHPGSSWVYISSHYNYNAVSVNLVTGEVGIIALYSVGAPYNWFGGCVWDLEGKYVYALSTALLSRIDPILMRHTRLYAKGGIAQGPVLLSADGKRVLVFGDHLSGDYKIRSVDANTGALIKESSGFAGVEGFAVSPDGKRIYLSISSRQQVKVFDSVSLSEIRSVDVVKPGVIAVSPDSRLLYFASEGKKIRALDTVNFQQVQTFDVGGDPKHLVLSHDSSRLYVAYKNKTVITAIQVE